MQAMFLPLNLRQLSRHMSHCAALGVSLPPEHCRRVARALQLAARQADELASQAADIGELEDELLAVAGDMEATMSPPSSGFQAALKAQQAAIQRQLDAGGSTPGQASRRAGLARLAVPISADGRVVALPMVPQPRPARVDCQGDGGDAA